LKQHLAAKEGATFLPSSHICAYRLIIQFQKGDAALDKSRAEYLWHPFKSLILIWYIPINAITAELYIQ
jgi:hypothetical protein